MTAVKPRFVYAERLQGEIRIESLDQMLPPEHSVRGIWEFVAGLDLSAFHAEIGSVPGRAGAPAIDRRILVALWLQATIDGIGSSRAVEKLCLEHLAYRWLCGGVEVGYHTLSDFKTAHLEALNHLMTQSIAAMLHENLIDLNRVAQDGMRVRAAAGASSFRRSATIEECLKEAQAQVEAVNVQEDEDAGAANRRAQAAQRRWADDRVARLQSAREHLEAMQQVNAAQPKSRQKAPEQVRVSTTDPECRKMKMPDGGFRAAYNVQLATTTVGGVIVGVEVTNEGTDGSQMPPMLEQIEKRLGAKPKEMLVDGGFATVEAIDEAEREGTTVYAPIKKEKEQLEAGQDPYERKKSDTDETAKWRARMAKAEAKEIYKERASTAELSNAQARNRGFYSVKVRGRQKVLAIALWYALAHNFRRLISLREVARNPKAVAKDGEKAGRLD